MIAPRLAVILDFVTGLVSSETCPRGVESEEKNKEGTSFYS